MQLGALYKELKAQLPESPELEARRLIEAVAGVSAIDFISKPALELSEAHVEQINTYMIRRLEGEPLSKILGLKEFWGLEFEVNQHVLDPRPDTETLIEAVLAWVDREGFRDAPLNIADLGTGSACIPIALLSELPNAKVTAVDISAEALEVAKKNMKKHKMSSRMILHQGSWFEGLEGQDFDIITSNPPYIPESDIENLSKEVKNHDPILALSGGNDGLDDYKKIIFGLKNKLNGNNRAFLEIGIGQLESLARLVDESNLLLCDSKADLAGIPRVVEISK